MSRLVRHRFHVDGDSGLIQDVDVALRAQFGGDGGASDVGEIGFDGHEKGRQIRRDVRARRRESPQPHRTLARRHYFVYTHVAQRRLASGRGRGRCTGGVAAARGLLAACSELGVAYIGREANRQRDLGRLYDRHRRGLPAACVLHHRVDGRDGDVEQFFGVVAALQLNAKFDVVRRRRWRRRQGWR